MNIDQAQNHSITIIDETLREGMQYRGLMFSKEQRLTILDFQEQLGVDICQAGYPSAHENEAKTIRTLVDHAEKNKYATRIAAMGRATLHDASIMIETGVHDFHLHFHIQPGLDVEELERALALLLPVLQLIEEKVLQSRICLVMLDIGRSDDQTLERCIRFCNQHKIDMLSLPDTSGIMAPNQIFDTLTPLCKSSSLTRISTHCHNDLGMASANSVMGIVAGGKVLEASAMGVGERNGLADLFTTAKTLQDQGYTIHLNTSDIQIFKAYYQYIDQIVYEQLGEHLLTANTPFFGSAVKTHVAGTHAGGEYGIAKEEQYYLNSLCGRHLVKKFLNLHKINYPETLLPKLTQQIKSYSIEHNRSLTPDDIKKIIVLHADSG